MATKKDLVEAYSFSRRRLVTAFVSGAPGGREVEPARPGRMIVGGVALAILLIAGAAVAGALTDRAPADWRSPGLVTDDHGSLYVYLAKDQASGQEPLRQIINVTSAQLILGAGVKTRSVPEDELAEEHKGPPIGILDAPSTVPAANQLINSGWTSCTAADRGLKTEVTTESGVERVPGMGFVVVAKDTGKKYLIAEASVPRRPDRAYRYELPPDNDALYDALHIFSNDEITVPDEWLTLFPDGDPLNASGLGFANWGASANQPNYSKGARVGDYYVGAGGTYALTRSGAVALTDFAAAVLKSTRFPGGGQPAEVKLADPSTFKNDTNVPFADASWPADVVERSVSSSEQICAVLETEEDSLPAVRLAIAPVDSGMLDGVAAGRRDVNVMSGTGALIRSAGWNDASGGTIHLIDDRGRSNSVAGEREVTNLGYKKVPPVVIPATWNKLFQVGADLDYLAALCPPTTEQRSRDDADKATCS